LGQGRIQHRHRGSGHNGQVQHQQELRGPPLSGQRGEQQHADQAEGGCDMRRAEPSDRFPAVPGAPILQQHRVLRPGRRRLLPWWDLGHLKARPGGAAQPPEQCDDQGGDQRGQCELASRLSEPADAEELQPAMTLDAP
jgi:hypothetical protein